MPDRLVTWATRGHAHIGPKQIFLIIAGAFCVLRGLAYVNSPPVPPGLTTLGSVAPLGVWGWAWIIAGIIAFASVRWRHWALALTPMLILCSLWAFSYTAEWAVTVWLRDGDSRDWITGVSYAFQAASVLIVSRLVDPTEVTTGDRSPNA